jgi:hypothetical protein
VEKPPLSIRPKRSAEWIAEPVYDNISVVVGADDVTVLRRCISGIKSKR